MEWLTASLVAESEAASRVFVRALSFIRVRGADGPD